jgi:hypothetical protein
LAEFRGDNYVWPEASEFGIEAESDRPTRNGSSTEKKGGGHGQERTKTRLVERLVRYILG